MCIHTITYCNLIVYCRVRIGRRINVQQKQIIMTHTRHMSLCGCEEGVLNINRMCIFERAPPIPHLLPRRQFRYRRNGFIRSYLGHIAALLANKPGIWVFGGEGEGVGSDCSNCLCLCFSPIRQGLDTMSSGLFSTAMYSYSAEKLLQTYKLSLFCLYYSSYILTCHILPGPVHFLSLNY